MSCLTAASPSDKDCQGLTETAEGAARNRLNNVDCFSVKLLARQ
jgi:hypothetical protein